MERINRLFKRNDRACAVNEINEIIDGYDKSTAGGDESSIGTIDRMGRIIFCEKCQRECEVKYAGIGKRWFKGRDRSALVSIPKKCKNPAVPNKLKLGIFVRKFF